MERKDGIEPSTYALPRRCSTTELLGPASADGSKHPPIAQAPGTVASQQAAKTAVQLASSGKGRRSRRRTTAAIAPSSTAAPAPTHQPARPSHAATTIPSTTTVVR